MPVLFFLFFCFIMAFRCSGIFDLTWLLVIIVVYLCVHRLRLKPFVILGCIGATALC